MTPSDTETFEACWPVMARDLEAILAKRGIDPHTREDLIQETALRLLARWERLDKTRPILPLAATIALNLMRDRFRRGKHEIVSEIETLGTGDVERESMARVELSRVARAMKTLSPSYRGILLANVADDPQPRLATVDGIPAANAPSRSPAATKMLRMRARRRLAFILETAGVLVASLRLRLHQLFNEPGQTTATAFGAGAVLVATMVAPLPEPVSPAAGPRQAIRVSSAGHEGRLLAPAVPVAAAPASDNKLAGTLLPLDHPSAPLEPAERNGDPDARAKTGIHVDPSGETVAETDAGVVAARARRDENDHYSVCLRVGAAPASSDACAEGEGS